MSDSNKELIAQKAISLFASKGYAAAGVQEICEDSGITKPTLYHYFKCKKGLLEFIIQTKGEELFIAIQEALIYEHDFIKSLTKVLQAEIDFAAGNKDFFTLYQTLLNAPEGSEEKEVSFPLTQKILQTFQNFFTSSCQEFGNMRSKSDLYSLLFHNQVVSLAMIFARDIIKADDQTIYQIIHSFVYGVAN